MTESDTKRSRMADADVNLGMEAIPDAWRTGTSKAFWDLRAAGRYQEAVDLLKNKGLAAVGREQDDADPLLCYDAEAAWETAELYLLGELGFPFSNTLWASWITRAAHLGHPRALVCAIDADFSTVPRDDRQREINRVWAIVNASDDNLAKWDMHMQHGAGGVATTFEFLRLAAEVDNIPDGHYLWATLGNGKHKDSYEKAARMGHPRACVAFAKGWRDAPFVEPMPMALRCQYLEIGARQGNVACLTELCAFLLQQESVRDWGKAAHLMMGPFVTEEVRSTWIKDRNPSAVNPRNVYYHQRLRELYAYGKHYVTSTNGICFGPVSEMYRDVRDAVRRSVIALIGCIRRRQYRAMCPTDIALMLAKPLWASRELRTEEWCPKSPHGGLSGAEQFAMTNVIRGHRGYY